MKNRKTVCWWLMLVLLLASCKRGSEYESVLPKDAALVVSVDWTSLAEKGGLSGKDGKELTARISDALKSGLEGSEKLVDRIVENPLESGIDLRQEVYAFVGSRSISYGLVARVSDKGKLEDLLEALHKQQLCSALVKENGYVRTAMGNMLVAYTSDALLMLGEPNGSNPLDLKRTAAKLLSQSKEDSYVAGDDFQKIKASEGDIVLVGSLDLIPKQYVATILMGIPGDLKLADVKWLTEVKFEQGKTTVDMTDLTTDPVMKQMREKQMQVFGGVGDKYLDLFPSNTGLWMVMNVDGKKMYEALCENPVLDSQLENSMMPIDFESIFNSVKGDMCLAGDTGMGKFILYADVTDTRFLQTFEDLKSLLPLTGGQMQLINRSATEYEFRIVNGSLIGLPPGYAVWWFGVSNGRFYVTNEADWIDARVLGLTLRDGAWAKQVKGKRFYLSLNAQAAWEENRAQAGRAGAVQALGVIGEMDYLTFEVKDMNHARMELVMKDQKRNALQSLFNTIQ